MVNKNETWRTVTGEEKDTLSLQAPAHSSAPSTSTARIFPSSRPSFGTPKPLFHRILIDILSLHIVTRARAAALELAYFDMSDTTSLDSTNATGQRMRAAVASPSNLGFTIFSSLWTGSLGSIRYL